MDITKMLNDYPISNYNLMENDTYVPQSKDLCKIDEISFQQSGMDIGPYEDKTDTIDTQMKIKNPPNDIETIMHSARVLLNQGLEKESILKQLKYNFTEDEIEKASKELSKVFKNEGVVGFIVIDLTSKNKHNELIKASKKSPFRKLFKAVLMTKDQIKDNIYVTTQNIAVSRMKTGSIDGMIGDSLTTESMSYYNPLNLPIISSIDEIDNSLITKTFDQLSDFDDINDDYVFEENTNGLRKAFHLIHKNKKKERSIKNSNAKIDTNNYMINSKQYNIDVDEKSESSLDIDPSCYLEPEYTGSDKIELNDENEIESIDIKNESSLDW